MAKRTITFRDADFARERMRRAVYALATSQRKLRERVLDAYSEHVSMIQPLVKFFPDRDTLNDLIAIRQIIRTTTERIEKNPGPYERLLRDGVMNSFEIARSTLDYRIARRLAKLITDLYFKLHDGLEWEYEDDLRKHAPIRSSEEILAEMSRRLKSIHRQKSRTKEKSATAFDLMTSREYLERESGRTSAK